MPIRVLLYVTRVAAVSGRALMFVSNQFGGVVPAVELTSEEIELLALVNREIAAYADSLEAIRYK